MNWDDPAYGEDWRGIDKVKALSKKQLLQAIEDGHFTQADRFMPGMNKIGKRARAAQRRAHLQSQRARQPLAVGRA